jgi:hypothetical protein
VSESSRAEWIDFDRSLTLAREVFLYRGLENREVWADRASVNIPVHFYVLFVQLAEAAVGAGRDEVLAGELMDRADAFYVTSQGGSRLLE